MTKLNATQRKQKSRARKLGEKQRAAGSVGGGNPYSWTTQRHMHDAWATGYLNPRPAQSAEGARP